MKIENLDVIYGSNAVLKNVNIEIKPGIITVISGKSGSGKTSILNMIGLVQKSNKECSITYNNINLLSLKKNEKSNFIKNNIGYVYQQNNLINSLNVYDNVALQLRTVIKNEKEIEKKVVKYLKYVDILDLKDKFPSEISGGEEQRVAIARAMVMNQKIILADEPTSALDNDNKEIIMGLFSKIAQEGVTVIISTHDRDIIKEADEHYHISNKEIILYKEKKMKTYLEIENKDKINNLIFPTIIKFNRKQNKKPIPKFILLFIGIILSISTIGLNVTKKYNENYKQSIELLADKSIFVINDTISIKGRQDHEDLLSFSEDEIKKISVIEGIKDIEPFFEFTGYGLTEENVHEDFPLEYTIDISEDTFFLEKMYSVQPLYEEDFQNHYFFDILPDINDEDLIVSEEFLDENLIPNTILGEEITINIYIPIKQYHNTVEKNIKNEYIEYKSDGNIYLKTSITTRIGGILNSSYPYERGSNGNTFFMKYKTMSSLLNNKLDHNVSGETFEGFPDKKMEYSAYHIVVEKINDINNVIQKVEETSNKIEVVSAAQNIELMEESITDIEKIAKIVTYIILVLSISVLFSTFYLTNNSRKKQVGILKSLGLNKQTIIGIYLYELLGYSLVITILPTILGTISMYFLSKISLEKNIGIIYYFIQTFGISFALALIVVLLSGVIPVILALKQEPVDIIRLNK